MSDRVKIFSTRNCPFCKAAKRLLDVKQVAYQEVMVDTDEAQREEMVRRSKRTSVPQIFIGDLHVGGYQEMAELDADGKLDELLKGAGGA